MEYQNPPATHRSGCGAPKNPKFQGTEIMAAPKSYQRQCKRSLRIALDALPCIVKGCSRPAAKLRCPSHEAELAELVRAQGKEWGRDRNTLDVRFFYASRKGF